MNDQERKEYRRGYTSPIEVSPLDDGEHWRVLRSYGFYVVEQGRQVITVEAGTITDFASFPKILWRGLMWWLPAWAKYNKAPPIHDELYKHHGYRHLGLWYPVTRKRADQIFLEAMHVAFRHHKSGRAIARMEYLGVRAVGWLAWRKTAK